MKSEKWSEMKSEVRNENFEIKKVKCEVVKREREREMSSRS